MYSQAFTEDVARIKIMVFSVHAALTVQIIMLMNNLWRVYAAGFGDLGAFDLVSTTWFSVIVIESVGGSHIDRHGSSRACLTFFFYSGFHRAMFLCMADIYHLRKKAPDRVHSSSMNFHFYTRLLFDASYIKDSPRLPCISNGRCRTLKDSRPFQ